MHTSSLSVPASDQSFLIPQDASFPRSPSFRLEEQQRSTLKAMQLIAPKKALFSSWRLDVLSDWLNRRRGLLSFFYFSERLNSVYIGSSSARGLFSWFLLACIDAIVMQSSHCLCQKCNTASGFSGGLDLRSIAYSYYFLNNTVNSILTMYES